LFKDVVEKEYTLCVTPVLAEDRNHSGSGFGSQVFDDGLDIGVSAVKIGFPFV
jgi:hypothetical protein